MTDFGVAGGGESMTEEGAIMGAAQYLSRRRGAVDDDVISARRHRPLQLLTGQVPFTGDSPVKIAMKHLAETPPAPSIRSRTTPRT